MMKEYQSKRRLMVEAQIIGRGINDKRVINAMLNVPRHLFVDEALWPEAYEDHPLPIGEKQTISQPYIVALMSELLELTGKEKVLEIGTGSGYQCAILAALADQVFTVERIPSVAKRARKIFDQLKYSNVIVRIGDGTLGWKEHSPYDGIIVTAASPGPPQALLDQLKIAGRLVIPIGDEFTQELMVFRREENNNYIEENHGSCRFVKLIGNQGWRE